MRCGTRDVRRVLHTVFQSRIRVLLPGDIPEEAPVAQTPRIVS